MIDLYLNWGGTWWFMECQVEYTSATASYLPDTLAPGMEQRFMEQRFMEQKFRFTA